jgi:hypothetical protein
METFGGVITAFLVAALPLAVTVTKLVDTVRNLLGAAEAKVPKVVWNLLALVIGVIVALGFEINLIAPIAAAIPALKDWSPDSTAAEILTGLAIGAMGSFWHEKLDEWSSIAKGATPAPVASKAPRG